MTSRQKAVRKPANANTAMIPPTDLRKALSGEDPPTGRPLSLAQLGNRLAEHRRGAAPGQPYRKQTLAIYLDTPDKQGPDFEAAFLSWRTAERLRQDGINTRYSHLRDLLDEAAYVVEFDGDDPPALFVVRRRRPDLLIDANGLAPKIVINRAPVRQCACGEWFVSRSWNHRRCGPDCAGPKP